MLTKSIRLIDFKNKSKNNLKKIKKYLKKIFKNKNQVIESLGKSYKVDYNNKKINSYKKFSNFRLIGMGGSVLGTQAIYDFLKNKIKKNFVFIDNLQNKKNKIEKKKYFNLIISKSGNTIETIVNANFLIKKNEKNIFITENKKII